MNIEEVKKRLKEIKSHPIKKWGQSFLVNSQVIQKIVKEVKKHPPPWVEVGPGLGALTDHFLQEKPLPTLVERDKKLAHYWEQKGFPVICEDVLKLNRQAFPPQFTLFGNLPYQVSGSLVIKMTCMPSRPHSMIFMMQKEVAQGVIASPETQNYGILSLISQVFWDVGSFLEVSKQNFYPKPQVDGRVLCFDNQKNSHLDPQDFLLFVKACFKQRRKKLLKQVPCKSLDKVLEVYSQMGLSQNIRAEQLSPSQMVRFYNSLKQTMG